MAYQDSKLYPTAFSGGLNNLQDDDLLITMGLPDPSPVIVVFEDFVTASSLNNLLKTETGAGTNSLAAFTPEYRAGGLLSMTCLTGVGNAIANTLSPLTTNTLSSDWGMRCRFANATSVANSIVAVGLANAVPNGKAADIVDGIFILKEAGSTQFLIRAVVNGVTFSSAFINPINTYLAGDYVTLTLYSGETGTYIAELTNTNTSPENVKYRLSLSLPSNVFPSFVPMSPFLSIENVVASASTARVDYFLTSQKRYN